MSQMPSAMLCFLAPKYCITPCICLCCRGNITVRGASNTPQRKQANTSHCDPNIIKDSQETTTLIPLSYPAIIISLFKLERSHLLIAVREQHEEALGHQQPDPVVGRAVPLHEQQVHVITECDEADGLVTARMEPLEGF